MRDNLNIMIVRHYFMREIGYETYELWSIMLETKLREIMPYYQELYRTTLFEIDLDNPYHMVTEHTEEGNDQRLIGRNGDSSNSSKSQVNEGTENSVNSSQDVTVSNTEKVNTSSEENNKTNTANAHSDFPQASFSNGDYASWTEEGNSTSNTDRSGNTNTTTNGTTKTTGNENSEGSRNITSSDSASGDWRDFSQDNGEDFMHYLHDVKGHTSNKEILEAIEKWRNLIININELIIKELANMFILLYN